MWPGGADPPAELEEATLAAASPVEHGQLDLVAAVAERVLELRDEGAEIGIRRPWIHLRDEEDPQ
jgi:hypothetical protein